MLREKLNSMNLLLYMAPIAVLLLLPATIFMEENVVGITVALAREDFKIIVYLLFNSCLAYFVNLTNFLVTKHTSALTLQVRVIGRSFFYYFFCITLLKYEFIPVHLIADFSLICFLGSIVDLSLLHMVIKFCFMNILTHLCFLFYTFFIPCLMPGLW